VIRPARAEDAEALAALQTRSWRAAYGDYVDDERIDAASERREERWRELLAGKHGTFVIVGADAALVGFVSVGPSRDADARPGDGELYAIYVEPSLAGTGVGSELIRYAEAELARHHRAATLWVFEQNAGARAFYQRHGWAPDDRAGDPERWDWAPSVRYRKALSPEARHQEDRATERGVR
jgi:ribosomal protein S18 acetylase RimI-like enzyme